jgi:hypothetical protein
LIDLLPPLLPLSSFPPKQGRDHTIYSLIEGRVRFSRDARTKRRYISVDPPLDLDTAAGAQQQQQQRLVPAATQQLQQQPAL